MLVKRSPRPLCESDIARIDGYVIPDGNFAFVYPLRKNSYRFLVIGAERMWRNLDPNIRYTIIGIWNGFNLEAREITPAPVQPAPDMELAAPFDPEFFLENQAIHLPAFEKSVISADQATEASEAATNPDLTAAEADHNYHEVGLVSGAQPVTIDGKTYLFDYSVSSHWHPYEIAYAAKRPWVSYAVCIGHLDDVFPDDSLANYLAQ